MAHKRRQSTVLPLSRAPATVSPDLDLNNSRAVEPQGSGAAGKVLDGRRGPAQRRPRRQRGPIAAPAGVVERRMASAAIPVATAGMNRPIGRAEATYAALDLGTNNCRLLIARPTADGFRVVDAFSRIIRLGEGVAASRRISEAAIARAVEALLVCRDKMHARGVVRARLIATEACRAAENGEAFRNRVAEQAGLELEIIDSATEARLAATGCTELFDPAASSVILFDIGGGSSELVRLGRPGAGRRGPPKPDIVGWASLPLGVVTLAERYGGNEVSARDLRGHGEEVARFVEKFAADYPCDRDGFHMLGTSGTVTTIAGVFLRLKRYDRRRVDGCWLSDEEISARGRRAHGHEFRRARGQPVHRPRARRPGAGRLRHP